MLLATGLWVSINPVRVLQLTTMPCFSFLTSGRGLLQSFSNLLSTLEAVFPHDIDWILHHWGNPGAKGEGFDHWPTDATGDVHPVNCHSHNDYWRSVPLYAAVRTGCIGAEADIWLVDDQLYVGHSTASLTSNRTLQNLYIHPLLDLLEKQNYPAQYQPNEGFPSSPPKQEEWNGIFEVDPTQTFVLLIDFKTSGPETWSYLFSQLAPLREKGYLTHFDGSTIIERPITVVGTGYAPFDLLKANSTYRDVFFDAPLDELADLSSQWPNPNRAQDPSRRHDGHDEVSSIPLNHGLTSPSMLPQVGHDVITPHEYTHFNSYYASVSFTRSIGRVWGSRLTQAQLQLIRSQIRGAHARGLKVRYWSLPQWPIGLRNHVWHILIREGVDILNVDDLRQATMWDWRRRKGWWG